MFGRRYQHPFAWMGPFSWLGGVAVIAAAIALDGFILRCLWNWHASPVFGLRTLNIYQGMGLALLVLMWKSSKQDENPYEDFWKKLGASIEIEVMCLVVGFVLHLLT